MKTYHIIKQVVIDDKLKVQAQISVHGKSYDAALKSYGAREPKLFASHSRINFYRDVDGWTYIVALERTTRENPKQAIAI